MFNLFLIFISLAAATAIAAGTAIIFRPADKAKRPVRTPAEEIITVMSVDTEFPTEEHGEVQAVPVGAMERELELSDMHEGDIIVRAGTSPETEETAVPTPNVQETGPFSAADPLRPEEPSDVVSKTIQEEHEEASDDVPERPLELFEDQTY